MNSSTGVSSQLFITDDELSNSNSSASRSNESLNCNGNKSNKMILKQNSKEFDVNQLEQILPNIESEPNKDEPMELAQCLLNLLNYSFF